MNSLCNVKDKSKTKDSIVMLFTENANLFVAAHELKV